MEYEYAVGVKLDGLSSSNDRSVNSVRERLRHRRIGEQRVQALAVARVPEAHGTRVRHERERLRQAQ